MSHEQHRIKTFAPKEPFPLCFFHPHRVRLTLLYTVHESGAVPLWVLSINPRFNANTYPWSPLVRSISVMVTSPWSLLSRLFVVFFTFLVFFSVMVKLEWTSTSPIFAERRHWLNLRKRLNSGCCG